MAEDIELKVRAQLEDELSSAISAMSSRVQAGLSAVTRQFALATSSVKSTRQEVRELNQVFSSTSAHGRTVAQSISNLNNNFFTLRNHLKQSKEASRLLSRSLVEISIRRNEITRSIKQQMAAGAAENYSSIRGAREEIKVLREQERQIRRVKAAYDSINVNSFRMKMAVLNKDVGLVGKSMINFGKDLNYVGRNLTFALSLPILGFSRYGIDNLRRLDKEVIRTRKILDDSFRDTESLTKFMEELSDQLDVLSYKSTKTYQSLGIARELVQGLAADFAQLGVPAEQIFTLTRLTAELEKIGDVDITVAKEFITSAFQQAVRIQTTALTAAGAVVDSAEVAANAVEMITGSLYQLNLIENKTVLSLKSIADAFPEMQGVATTFGLTMLEAASFFAPMIAAGFEVGASANSIKVSLQRIVAPTKQNKEIMEELGNVLGEEFKFKAGIGIETIQYLVDGFTALEKSAYGTQGALEFFARLFGVRQGPRMEQAIRQLSIFQNQLQKIGSPTASIFKKVADSVNSELAKIGINKKFTADSIQSIGEITRYSAEAQAKGQTYVTDAIVQGQANAVDELREIYGDFYKQITNEAGKVLLAQALGPKAAQEIYDKELEAANNTVEAKLARARETFKAFSRDLAPIFVDIIEQITPIIQKFVSWFSSLPDSTKKLASIGLVLVALAGPLTTVVAIVSQIGGVVLRIFTGLAPKIFKFLRMPKILGAGFTDMAGGVVNASSKMTLFGRVLDNISGKAPRFARALDTAFGGIGGFKTNVATVGSTAMMFENNRRLILKSVLAGMFGGVKTNTEVDSIVDSIINQTTEKVGRNRVRISKKGSLLAAILGTGEIPFFKKTNDQLAQSIRSVGDAEDYVTSYIRQASSALGLQIKNSSSKTRINKKLKDSVDGVTDSEKKLGSRVIKTADINKRVATPVVTTPALMPGFVPFGELGPGPSRPPIPLGPGSFSMGPFAMGAVARTPLQLLEDEKEKLLAQLAGLQRKGPSAVSKRFDALVAKAKELGLSGSDKAVTDIFYAFEQAAVGIVAKPKKAIAKVVDSVIPDQVEAVTDIVDAVASAPAEAVELATESVKESSKKASGYVSKKKVLDAPSILSAFDEANALSASKGGVISESLKTAQREVADAIGSAGLTFQAETFDEITDAIKKGKILNVEPIVKSLEDTGKVSQSEWNKLWGKAKKDGKPPIGRTTKGKLFTDDIKGKISAGIQSSVNQVMITPDFTGKNGLASALSNRSRVERIRADLVDMGESFAGVLEEGTANQFERAVDELIRKNPKQKSAIERRARQIITSTTGQSYQTKYAPGRRFAVRDIDREIARAKKKMDEIAVFGGSQIERTALAKRLDDLAMQRKALSGKKYFPIDLPIPRTAEDLEDIWKAMNSIPIGEDGGGLLSSGQGTQRSLSRDFKSRIRMQRASRMLGANIAGVSRKDEAETIKRSFLARMFNKTKDRGRFLSGKYSGIISSFAQSSKLMSFGPFAGIAAMMTAMSDAPGGIIAKLFGGAGGAMMAAAGKIDKGAIETQLIDALMKRKGIKGAAAKNFKTQLFAKLATLGDRGKEYLEVLSTPLSKLADNAIDMVNQLPEIGQPAKTKKSIKQVLETLRSTPEKIKQGSDDVISWASRSLDRVILLGDDIETRMSRLPEIVDKSLVQSVQGADVHTRAAKAKASSSAKKTNNASKKMAKKVLVDPIEALNKEKDKLLAELAGLSKPQSTSAEARYARLLAKAKQLGLSNEQASAILLDFADKAGLQMASDVSQVSEAVSATVAESASDASEKTKEKIIVESEAVETDWLGEPVVKKTVTEVKKDKEEVDIWATKEVAEEAEDSAEEAKRKIVTQTSVPLPTPPVVDAQVAETVADIREAGIVAQLAAVKHIDDSVQKAYRKAYGAVGGLSARDRFGNVMSKTVNTLFTRPVLRTGRAIQNTLMTPFTKLSNSAALTTIAVGRLGTAMFGIIPIFGKMIGRGLVNKGAAALQTTSIARSSLTSKFIDGKELSRTSKIIRTMGVDLGSALFGLAQLINPMKAIAGIFKGIMTSIKIGLALTGIGTVLLLIAGAVVAVKNSVKNFQPIMDQLKEAWRYISEALTIVAKPLMDMVMAFAGVNRSAKETGDSLTDSANSSRGAIATIVGFIVFISKKFRENADKIAKFVKEKVVPVFVQIINIIILIGKLIVSLFSGSFGKAGDAGDELWRRILYGFLGIVKTVLPIVKEFLKVAVIAFAKLADFITNVLIKAAGVAFAWIADNAFKLIGGIMRSFAPGGRVEDATDRIWQMTVDKYGVEEAKRKFEKEGLKIPITAVGIGIDGEELAADFAKDFADGMMESDAGETLSEWFRAKVTFDQGWIEGVLDGALSLVDGAFNGILTLVDNAMTGIAEDFEKKFGKPINQPIVLSPDLDGGNMDDYVEKLAEQIGTALDQSGEAIGDSVGGAVKNAVEEALKDLQQRFVDLVVDYLGDQISKYKEQLTQLLEKQKEDQLAFFDDQIAALEALEKAEEELTATKEYETGRRRMIEDRDLQRANYQRNRALAIYEGRVDDARNLDLEEEKNTRDFRDNLDDYDKDRAKELQARQRETVKSIIEQQKKDAEKAFDEMIKNYEKFIENIGKYGTYNQEELEKQFKELQEAAQGASIEMALTFEEYYRKLPGIISKYTDPTIGYFSEPLDKLIEIARSKFGLGADSGVSPDTILGNTALMLSGVTEKIRYYEHIMGGAFGSSLRTMIDDYIIPAMTEIDQVFEDFDPGQILKEAIDNANMVLLREQQKLIDGMASLVKGMENALDPAIAKWYALKAAIEAAAGAASNAGSPSPPGGPSPTPPSTSADMSKLTYSYYTSAFNQIFPRSAFAPGSEGTLARNAAMTGTFSQLYSYVQAIAGGTSKNDILKFISSDTGYNKYIREFLNNYSFMAGIFGGAGGGPGINVRYNGGMIKKYGVGGYAVPGFKSTAVPAILHGGEYVINSKAVQNIGMATLQSLNNMRFSAPGRMQTPQVTTINETKNVNIYVDNFIGQDQWFESMMKEYNIKVVPRNQKSAGLDVRKVSSYSGLNRGM